MTIWNPVLVTYRIAVNTLHTGGASVSPEGHDATGPGYMVSIPGREWRLQVGDIALGDRSQADADRVAKFLLRLVRVYVDWAATRTDDFLQDKDWYVGAWIDTTDTGSTLYLDTSLKVRSRKQALQQAIRWGQRAVYDLTTGESIYVEGE